MDLEMLLSTIVVAILFVIWAGFTIVKTRNVMKNNKLFHEIDEKD